ncbi:hypothetical protein [Halorubrum sp. HHNYT27]|uniref:hypothetical protein n=1 Tax=Halorubrum sp. HHNYT27 TaxID=3402275 RepID=UPI003EBAF16D
MGESSITILELHLGDGDIEIGPFELFGSADGAELTAVADAEADDDETDVGSDGGVSAKSVAGLLLALIALAAVAVGVAKLRGDEEEEIPSGIAGDE